MSSYTHFSSRLRLALTLLLRDWRAGELRVLAFALVVAVASVTTVGFFADRVQHALSGQANELIGADMLVIADHVLPASLRSEAQQRKLATAALSIFPSMVVNGERNQLAEIKAVENGYPLRGKLRIANAVGTSDVETSAVPEPGSVWVDEKLANQLTLRVNDRIAVGAAQLRVAAILTREPDNALRLFNIAPRLLMNQADIAATHLIQPGSRITYRLMLAGTLSDVEAYRVWATAKLARGERIESVRDARPEVRSALERAEKFLGLAALVSVILAGIAVALAARRYGERHLDATAIMRCFGAAQSTLLQLHLVQFFLLGVAASAIGAAIGYVAQEALSRSLAGMVAAVLPPASFLPALYGLVTGLILLAGFAVPPLLRLRQVPTLRVIRRELGSLEGYDWLAYVLGFCAIAALLLWKSGDLQLGLYMLGGLLATIVVCGSISFLLLRLLAGYRDRVGVIGRLGLAGLGRRATSTTIQVIALSLGIMALLLLSLVRNDLLQGWQKKLPSDVPNRFIISIQPDQVKSLQDFFAAHHIAAPMLFPMVRGRLVAINEKPVGPTDYPEENVKRLVEREFNLSWTQQLQSDNQIVAGRAFSKTDGSNVLSVEEGIAKSLKIGVGDVMTYDVAGQRFSAKIVNLRKVDWDSFRVNFFVISPPGLLEQFPASYITSFYLAPQQASVLGDLVNTFPNFTVIDVAAIMEQIRTMMDRVSNAVQFVFLFTLFAGLIVLYAAIGATQDERIYEAAMLRTLGAGKRHLILAQLAEFVLIGALSGLIAAAGASGLSYFLSIRVLHITYTFNGWIWLVGLAAGTLGVAAAGLIGTRRTISQPPLTVLNKLA